MRVKETICTEIDARGRIIKRTRTVDISDDYLDREYDYATRYGLDGAPQRVSSKRIFEAYEDYHKSNQW